MRIFIVDDEQSIAHAVQNALIIETDHEIEVCSDACEAEKKILSNNYDIVLLDIMMPQRNGNEILKSAKKSGVSSEFIMLTAVKNVPVVVECLKNGAYDYILKPPDIDIILSVISHASEKHQLKKNVDLFVKNDQCDIPAPFSLFHTTDTMMIKLLNYAYNIAQQNSNVCIIGETGTGKDVIAQGIHNASARCDKPFIVVNINAIPETLFESTLFGHVKGAFTDASTETHGLVAQAHTGTLFLDEIGDLDLQSQIKLLRLIENKQYYKVGSSQIQTSDFRLVCATNKDLLKEIKAGNFRQDLYYRICESEIYIPPIRARGYDSVYLSQLILSELNEQNNTEKVLSSDFQTYIKTLELEGNFRQLRHIITRAYYSSSSDTLHTDNNTFSSASESTSDVYDLEYVKKHHIMHTVSQFPTLKEAAEALGISYRQLYNYTKKYDIK